ncbi:MAG: ATP-binding protein [Cyanobacteriota bacterium]|nr:ATP-binding protein [Cyanobacteriota bacterium]
MSIFGDRNPETRAAESGTANRMNIWHRKIGGVRFRILVWYVLLTSSIIAVSSQITSRLMLQQFKQQAIANSRESIIHRAERFNTLKCQAGFHRQPATTPELAGLFDRFFEGFAPSNTELALATLNGQFYRTSSTPLPAFLSHSPQLIDLWSQQTQPEVIKHQGRKLVVFVKPIRFSEEVRGSLIIANDITDALKPIKYTKKTISVVTFLVCVLFALVAWFTLGGVLNPLSLLTKTARSITESNMNQRIPVKGTDETAELAKTFNEMLDRLQFAFVSQQAFLNDAGHELRTPITVIQGHLELLKLKPERQEQTIDLVVDELSRMNRLVNDLLLLAKSECPDFLHLRPEELDWLTEEIYVKAQAVAPRDWRLECKGVSPIVVDRQRLTQAVMNLIANAVRHTQPDETIALGSRVRDDRAYFWVRDTGEGIDPAERERIFERFARGTHSDRYSEGEGAGLGLSIVSAIVSAHGGWVELDSVLGAGSTFTIVLPLVPEPDVTRNESHSHRRGQSSNYRISGNWLAGSRIHDSRR